MDVQLLLQILILALWHCRSSAGHSIGDFYCLADDTNPYVHFATKTGYNVGNGNISPKAIVPEGCEAIQVWHLIRHGTRYPGDNDILAFQLILPRLQRHIVNASESGQGELCKEDVSYLKDWSLGGLNTSYDDILAPQGEIELYELSSRFKAALPSLLDKPFSNDTFKFRHTDKQRTYASARAYARGLFGGAGDTIYMPPPIVPIDPLLQFYKICNKYTLEVEDNPEAIIEATMFQEGPKMTAVVDEVSRRIGINVAFGEVEVMYDACRYYKAWDPPTQSAWCAVFTPENLMIMEYWHDLQYYYEDGYGHTINYQSACPPLQDLIQHFRYVVEGGSGPSGIFYFSHSGALLKVMARLGFFEDSEPLTHSNINPDRLWRTSYHGTFATNIAFVLSDCGPEKGWWVSAMVSETLEQLPGCPSKDGCSWEDFLLFYGQYEQCDFDAICENDREPTLKTGENGEWSSSSETQKLVELWRDFRSFAAKIF